MIVDIFYFLKVFYSNIHNSMQESLLCNLRGYIKVSF